MIHAIDLLMMEAHARRSMTTLNTNTISEHAAMENQKLTKEYELAAEALRRMHNKVFEAGITAGVQSIVESCNARRNRKILKVGDHD